MCPESKWLQSDRRDSKSGLILCCFRASQNEEPKLLNFAVDLGAESR